MRVAIPIENESMEGQVCPSFGRTPFYLIYDDVSAETKYLVNEAAVASGGAGIKAAQLLVDEHIDVVITPRCGKNAAEVLQGASVKIYKSEGDMIKLNVEAFTKGELVELDGFHPGFHGHGGSE